MNGTERVKLSKVIEKMQLKNLTPDIDTSGIWLHMPEVNRPALQLTGFYDQFDNDRIQIIGNVEYSYLASMKDICSFFQAIFHVLFFAETWSRSQRLLNLLQSIRYLF